MPTTLLSQLRDRVVIDVDSMDPDVARRHTKEARFCDMTSNQAIALGEILKAKDSETNQASQVLKAAVQTVKAVNAGVAFGPDQLNDMADVMTALFAKDVLPNLSSEGHVHAQTLPSLAKSTEGTIAHAKRLVKRFEAVGIPKSRVCIKIPATPQGILACRELQGSGINTLATIVFSLPQALAASQAGCLYVAPYFNELCVHAKRPEAWVKYKSTVEEHPAIPVIDSIIKAFKALESSTLVMPASIITTEEILALAALHPHHLTISPKILDQLAADVTTELNSVTAPGNLSSVDETLIKTDYLANNAEALANAFAVDNELKRKMDEALEIFEEAEEETRNLFLEELGRV
ncbi:hypothetical protein EIP91_008904 [Steccherinum ochraceum]|uniref:Transaldolase n=1 Tax=Steccherinum ochraceum TaxID=92696 RepID=A0A4R0RV86_9APHY|nr:hypothetical protein EIP91_008904 [Steccherinum ochraceum]